MSSSKGTSNSNKTAHVMNLLRKSNPTPPQAEAVQTEDAPQNTATAPSQAPAPTAQVPPIITALNADAEVSSQIKAALSEALAMDEAASGSPPHTAPAEVPIDASVADIILTTPPEEAAPRAHMEDIVLTPTEGKAVPAAPVEVPVSAPPVEQPQPAAPVEVPVSAPPVEQPQPAAPVEVPVSAPPVEQPQPAAPVEVPVSAPPVEQPQPAAPVEVPVSAPPVEQPQPAAPVEVPVSAPPVEAPVAQSNPNDAVLINVIQRLVEETADKYINLFGLCACPRCRRDVIAITMNGLPSCYVVMPLWEFNIRTDMYINRYSSEITAQLLRACRLVMDNPRHNLPGSQS